MSVKLSHYDVILSPVITEKSTNIGHYNQVAFEVARSATKPQIKEAVEAAFGVKVKSVNTLIRKGKQKRFRGRAGCRKDVKRAMICLAEGASLDIMAGI